MTVQNPRAIVSIAMVALVLALPAAAFEPGPQGVSPGALDRIARVGGACPTFSWEAMSGIAGYELVVHRVPDEASGSPSLELSPETEVLFTTVSGRATSWTPEASDCFAAGGAYVWFVRATAEAETGGGSEWSEPRFFEVEATPSPEQVRQALDVLQRYLETGDGDIETETLAARSRRPAASTGSRTGTASTKGASAPRSPVTATAAIRGEQPDSSGETYGVVGTSASPDGAGLGAANTAGGPDLVLDGTEDGEASLTMSQSGVARDSTQIESFNFSNPGTGEIDVHVEGWTNALEFVGGGSHLTGVDAETLDGIDGTAFATDAEAAGLVAAHAASADHDGRYYTKTELSTSGTADAVHWNNLGGVPPGFADGIDNDTSYTMGPGLIIDNGEIQIDPAAFSLRIRRWDSPADAGYHTSLAIGADGLGLISFYNASGGQLIVRHCNDILCNSTNSAVVDTIDDVGQYSSVAIGTDGYPLISYFDATNDELKVAHCENVDCSSSSTITIGGATWDTSLAIGTDGLGLITYADVGAGPLYVTHCENTACSSSSTYSLDSFSWYPSVTIGADGFGLISYTSTGLDLAVAHCENIDCSSSSTYSLDTDGSLGYHSSIAIATGSDGLGLIAYYDYINRNLKVAHCDNVECSSATISTLDSTGDVGTFTSVAIGADGLGLISYYDATNGDLKVAHCHNTKCTTAAIRTVDSEGDVGQSSSVAIGADGLPLISYRNADIGDLTVAHLPFWY